MPMKSFQSLKEILEKVAPRNLSRASQGVQDNMKCTLCCHLTTLVQSVRCCNIPACERSCRTCRWWPHTEVRTGAWQLSPQSSPQDSEHVPGLSGGLEERQGFLGLQGACSGTRTIQMSRTERRGRSCSVRSLTCFTEILVRKERRRTVVTRNGIWGWFGLH